MNTCVYLGPAYKSIVIGYKFILRHSFAILPPVRMLKVEFNIFFNFLQRKIDLLNQFTNHIWSNSQVLWVIMHHKAVKSARSEAEG